MAQLYPERERRNASPLQPGRRPRGRSFVAVSHIARIAAGWEIGSWSVDMYETLTLEFSGQLATLTLNRPDKRNAIIPKMISELQSALDEIENGRTRVAIVTGAGKSFCAGMDLEMLSDIANQSSAENMDDSRRMAKMFRRIWSFSKPLDRRSQRRRACRRLRHRHALRLHPRRSRSKIRLHRSENRIPARHRFRLSDAPDRRQTRAQPAPHRSPGRSGGSLKTSGWSPKSCRANN